METKVLTPKGFKRIGDVQVGDRVCNPDGTVSRVIQVHDQGPQPFYRVTMADGSTVEASEGHLWAVSVVGGRRRRKHGVPDVPPGLRTEDEWNLRLAQRCKLLTTRELVDLVARADRQKADGKMPMHVLLPLTAPTVMTNPPGRWPTLPPYTLGVLVGNGHLGENAVTFISADQDIARQVQAELGGLLRVVLIRMRNGATEYRLSGESGRSEGSPQEFLRRDGLLGCRSWEKSIPDRIKRAPIAARFAFARGLFDTDGHMDSRGHIEFTTVSERLARDVQWLVRSLGFKATLGTKQPTYTHQGEKRPGRLAYRLHVRGPHQERLFGLARKVERAKRYNGQDTWPGHRVVSVVPSGTDNARCITVDHPNGLYVTDDFIVTHNSHWMVAQIAADDCQRCPGLKALILRRVGKAARESFEDLRPKVLGHLRHEYRRDGTLTFPNGSRIILGHFQRENDIDAYLGLEYDVIGQEESTTLSTAKDKAVAGCLRTSKTDWRPRRYHTTNPGGVGHQRFKEAFVAPYRRNQQTSTRFIPATSRDNPFLNPEYQTWLDGLSGWLRKAWRDGDWDVLAGQFFKTWKHDVHVVPPIEIPTAWPVWLGFDYGFTHYTYVCLLAQTGDGDLYVVAEHAERGWLVPRHAAAIRAMLARHGVAPHRLLGIFAGADVFSKRHQGGTIAEDYAAAGLHLRPANDERIGGAAEVLARLGDPENGHRPTLYVSTACPRLIECLPALEHDPRRPEDVLKVDCDEDGVGGDDPYDACRYGVMAIAGRRVMRMLG